jgi:hypothetical protein
MSYRNTDPWPVAEADPPTLADPAVLRRLLQEAHVEQHRPTSDLFDSSEEQTRIMDLAPLAATDAQQRSVVAERKDRSSATELLTDLPAPPSSVILVREPGFPLYVVLAAFAVGSFLTAAAIMLEYAVLQ